MLQPRRAMVATVKHQQHDSPIYSCFGFEVQLFLTRPPHTLGCNMASAVLYSLIYFKLRITPISALTKKRGCIHSRDPQDSPVNSGVRGLQEPLSGLGVAVP